MFLPFTLAGRSLWACALLRSKEFEFGCSVLFETRPSANLQHWECSVYWWWLRLSTGSSQQTSEGSRRLRRGVNTTLAVHYEITPDQRIYIYMGGWSLHKHLMMATSTAALHW
jgi:hypothetical protein